FFTLSGFLITWLLLTETNRFGTISLIGFYQRRFLRIFPAFYCSWFLTVGTLLWMNSKVPWSECLSAFFYTSNYYYPLHPGSTNVMGMTWSLGVEEQFYLLWPLVFVKYGKNLKALTQRLIAVILLVWAYRVGTHFSHRWPDSYLQYA